MRLYVVYDDRGRVLAATQVPAEVQLGQEPGERDAQFDVPLSEPDEHAAEFDVPAEFAERDLHELVPRLQVNVKQNRLVEKL